MSLWKSEDNFWVSILSTIWNQGVKLRFGSKCCYTLSFIVGPTIILNYSILRKNVTEAIKYSPEPGLTWNCYGTLSITLSF